MKKGKKCFFLKKMKKSIQNKVYKIFKYAFVLKNKKHENNHQVILKKFFFN